MPLGKGRYAGVRRFRPYLTTVGAAAALAMVFGYLALDLMRRHADAALSPDPPQTPVVQISAGQSWRGSSFGSMGSYGFDPKPNSVLTLGLSNPLFPSGILPVSAGIALPAGISGIANYSRAMRGSYPPPASRQDTGSAMTIGRASQLAQTYLREAHRMAAGPIIEYDMACPSSDWTAGPCGGLGPGSNSWRNMTAINAAIARFTPTNRPVALFAAQYKSVGWTQGGALDGTVASTLKQWADMEAAYDALNLPGAGTTKMQYYIGIRGANSDWAVMRPQVRGSIEFVRANGNGRTWGTNPWYQYPYPGSGIHFGDYGAIRLGEFEGYARYVVEDERLGHFYPLWLSRNRPITASGQNVSIPFDRPSGSAFAASPLAWASDPTEGISTALGFGFHVKRNGADLTVTATISGMNVNLAIAEPVHRGDVLEVTYCWYGPGGIAQGRSGILGNLMMAGPASVFYRGKTINAWAWPIPPQAVTVP